MIKTIIITIVIVIIIHACSNNNNINKNNSNKLYWHKNFNHAAKKRKPNSQEVH